MSVNTTVTGWAAAQFGDCADEVARRVVQALADAQRVGTRTQRASGQTRRYAYGSTWTSKYEQMIYQFTEAPGAKLPVVNTVHVPHAAYNLVQVAGRMLIPFSLARSLAEVPEKPTLTSEILRLIASRTVPAPAPAPAPSLFDLPGGRGVDERMPAQRSATDSEPSTPATATGALPPVFIGYVANADSEPLLGLWWGNAQTINTETGRITWLPERLPLRLASVVEQLRPVPQPRDTDRSEAFDQGTAPEITVTARSQPTAVNPEPAAPEDEEFRHGPAAGDVDE